MNLLQYILRRIIIAIPVLFGLITIIFFISRVICPAEELVYSRIPLKAFSQERVDLEYARLGLNKPILVQYVVFVQDLLTGNWGYSVKVFNGIDVWYVISKRLPRTLEITFLSMIIATILGIKLGKMQGSNRNKGSDIATRIFTYIGVSIPAFIIGVFLVQLVLQTRIKIFPFYGYKSSGIGNPPTITNSRIIDCIITGNYEMLMDYLYHLVLPISAMIIVELSIIARQTRSSMIGVLQEDYIRTAYAKGCSKKMVIKKHALKNSVPPVITVVCLGFPKIFAGQVPLEVAFNFPGLGDLFYLSLRFLDYGLIIILIFLFGVIVITLNLIADILYAIIDPRVRFR